MLLLLVLLIVMILLFGASAVLGTLLGMLGWILGAISLIAFLVWYSTTFAVEAGTVFLSLLLGVPGGMLVIAYVGFLFENRRQPPAKRQTFSQFWKEHVGS